MAARSPNPRPAAELLGRRGECEALDRLVASVRAGQSRALVLRGEAGVGKTALLEYLVDRVAGCRIARAAGVESEMELAFAGLHQLCAPMLDYLDRVPGPQRDALATAFGVSAGNAPDRFLVGLAVGSLLSDVAAAQPLICLIDDAQWLDHASAQTLAFVARRLAGGPVGVVFATREPGQTLRGLPELPVRGLSDDDARALLASALRGPLDAAVGNAIVAEARGNPLALLELPQGLTPAELAGGFAMPDALPLRGRLEEAFQRRIVALPAQTQRLLLLAALEPVGDPALLWRAAGQLGIGVDAADPAAAAGLLEIGARVRFRHPLVRSATYRAARPEDRRRAHLALARATDAQADPDRRAWHHAHATQGADEEVAAELERSAGRAHARGGLAAAAAFLERAAELTVVQSRRAERLLAAAQAKHQAGAPQAALRLATVAEAGTLDELQRARVELLRGRVAFTSTRGRDAPPLLLAAARRLQRLDPSLARDTYLDALSAALYVGRLARDGGVREVATAARAAPGSAARPADLLLDGLARVITEGYAAGAPLLKQAVSAMRTEELPTAQALPWLWLATHAARDLWDDDSWDALSLRHARVARETGALTVLPLPLSARIWLHLLRGEVAAATSLADEIDGVIEATGSGVLPYAPLALAVAQGHAGDATELLATMRPEAVRRGEGIGLTATHLAEAVLCNGLGRYPDALPAASEAAEARDELAYANWALPELVEAAVRAGDPARATDALARLSSTTRHSGTDWALGIEARSRALVSDHDVAEPFYRDAIEHLGRTSMRMELGRAHLLYGEWLRRIGRRRDAREQLTCAHEILAATGAEAFATRAGRELLATGATVRKRTVETRDDLTAQEAQIAQLAGAGRTNAEIGAELFLSPRTIEWHLRKVFRKLDVGSRTELHDALCGLDRAA